MIYTNIVSDISIIYESGDELKFVNCKFKELKINTHLKSVIFINCDVDYLYINNRCNGLKLIKCKINKLIRPYEWCHVIIIKCNINKLLIEHDIDTLLIKKSTINILTTTRGFYGDEPCVDNIIFSDVIINITDFEIGWWGCYFKIKNTKMCMYIRHKTINKKLFYDINQSIKN